MRDDGQTDRKHKSSHCRGGLEGPPPFCGKKIVDYKGNHLGWPGPLLGSQWSKTQPKTQTFLFGVKNLVVKIFNRGPVSYSLFIVFGHQNPTILDCNRQNSFHKALVRLTCT